MHLLQEEILSDSESSYQADSESFDDSDKDEHYEPEPKKAKKQGVVKNYEKGTIISSLM